jgi:hypothetical protein
MINSDRRCPSASSRDHPKMVDACPFQSVTMPVASMVTSASSAVSTIARLRSWLQRRAAARAHELSCWTCVFRAQVEVVQNSRNTMGIRQPRP